MWMSRFYPECRRIDGSLFESLSRIFWIKIILIHLYLPAALNNSPRTNRPLKYCCERMIMYSVGDWFLHAINCDSLGQNVITRNQLYPINKMFIPLMCTWVAGWLSENKPTIANNVPWAINTVPGLLDRTLESEGGKGFLIHAIQYSGRWSIER